MKTIFAMFHNYTDAEHAVGELLSNSFPKEELNVIAQAASADQNQDWDKNRSDHLEIPVTGDQASQALDLLMARQQPVLAGELGKVYASGQLARLLVNSMVTPGTGHFNFRNALIDFGLSEESTGTIRDSVLAGGVLLFVRVDEDQAAEVGQILRSSGSQQIVTNQ